MSGVQVSANLPISNDVGDTPASPQILLSPEVLVFYFAGVKLNFWPATTASYIKPCLGIVKIATPSL